MVLQSNLHAETFDAHTLALAVHWCLWQFIQLRAQLVMISHSNHSVAIQEFRDSFDFKWLASASKDGHYGNSILFTEITWKQWFYLGWAIIMATIVKILQSVFHIICPTPSWSVIASHGNKIPQQIAQSTITISANGQIIRSVCKSRILQTTKKYVFYCSSNFKTPWFWCFWSEAYHINIISHHINITSHLHQHSITQP